ncbi:MAG: hypothetical protein WD407_00170 [Rhodospirillales bacterium]
MMKRIFGFSLLAFGVVLAGCSVKVGVKMNGDENRVQITAPDGYDTLGVAEKHCRSYKKKAVYAGRGEGHGKIITAHYNCMLR